MCMPRQVAYQPTEIQPVPEVIIIQASVQKLERELAKKYRKVAAYCRVSTDHKEQLKSYRTQIEYYTKKIKSNPNWKLVKVFADKGLSATSTSKRKEFLKMIEMCKDGKIDLILTKSISRFARNTLDAIQYVRMLKSIEVTIIFEKENINTSELSSEMFLQLYAMFSQAESESISNNVKDGKRKGYKLGKVPMMFGNVLGYKKGPNGEAQIVPEEAAIIVDIYTKFLEGWSLTAISKSLEEQGIKTKTGKDKWSTSVIRHILTNEKYKGDILMQKSYVADLFSRKAVKNTGELPQYLIKNHHIPIIDPNVFDMIQYEMSRRNNIRTVSQEKKLTKSKYSGKYALTEILVCAECGERYRRVTWTSKGEKRVVWRCINRLKYGKRVYKHSPTIAEEDLHKAIVTALNSLLTNKSTLHEMIKGSMVAMLGMNRSEMHIGKISSEIASLNNEIFDIVRDEIEKRTDSEIIEKSVQRSTIK